MISDGPMRMRLDALLVCLGLSLPAGAETGPADCAALVAAVQTVSGYAVTAPPAGADAGWCVLDRAVLRAASGSEVAPEFSAEGLRLRGTEAKGVAVSLEVQVTGLRLRSKAGVQAGEDRLRTIFRLQSADIGLRVILNPATDTLEIREGLLRLSGGTELVLSADIKGGGLTLASLAGGRLTALDLEWRNDGRLPRPLMELAGQRLPAAPNGTGSVEAARLALGDLIATLPETVLSGDDRAALARMVASLPQGRGRLRLSLTASEGIGAARLLVAGLSEDPRGAAALERLLSGVRLTAAWRPGLAP